MQGMFLHSSHNLRVTCGQVTNVFDQLTLIDPNSYYCHYFFGKIVQIFLKNPSTNWVLEKACWSQHVHDSTGRDDFLPLQHMFSFYKNVHILLHFRHRNIEIFLFFLTRCCKVMFSPQKWLQWTLKLFL